MGREISQQTVAELVNYLAGANAMMVKPEQNLVWHEYLNDPETGVADATEAELLTACKRTVRAYTRGDIRAVTPEAVADQVRRARRAESRITGNWVPDEAPTDPVVYPAWLTAYRQARRGGAGHVAAVAQADIESGFDRAGAEAARAAEVRAVTPEIRDLAARLARPRIGPRRHGDPANPLQPR